MNWVRSHFEYLIARSVATAIEIMPTKLAYSFGKAVGWLTYHLDYRHRHIGMQNIKAVFGDKLSGSKRKALLRRVYNHLGTVMVEMVITPKIVKRGEWRKIISVENLNGLSNTLHKKRPVIFITAHIGNWEITGTTMGALGYPLHSIARTMDNPLLDKYITTLRERSGKRVIKKHGSMREVIQLLKKGERLGIIADQNAPVDNVFVDFLGRKASVARGIAALAIKTNALIIPGYSYRDAASGKHIAIAEKPIQVPSEGTMEEKIITITKEFTNVIEHWVLKHPEQWLWIHNRWKTRPPEEKNND